MTHARRSYLGGWRLLHVAVGSLGLVALALHTGFSLGIRLNLGLMLAFLAVALSGSLVAATTALAPLGGGSSMH